MPITQCNFHPFTFYLPFHTSPPVGQCPIYAPFNCTMGLDTCARHPLFGRTDPYYTVIFYSSCGLNKRPAATLAFPLSVSVLSSQYLFQRGPIWVVSHQAKKRTYTRNHIYRRKCLLIRKFVKIDIFFAFPLWSLDILGKETDNSAITFSRSLHNL